MTSTPPPNRARRVLVTVGSTKFDDLIGSILDDAMLDVFFKHGFTSVVVQCGNSLVFPDWISSNALPFEDVRLGVHIHVWRFKPSLEDEIFSADLIISHAGSGTILDALRKGKMLIVVPNDTLLDNHQTELAIALSAEGYLLAATISNLSDAVAKIDSKSLTPFPAHQGSSFSTIVDEEMGFI